jgi:hypothetical protein
MAVFEASMQRNAADRHDGHELTWTASFQGLPSLTRRRLIPGESGGMNAAMELMQVLSSTMNHPLGRTEPKGLQIRLKPAPSNPLSTLTRLQLAPGPWRAGDEVPLEITWRDYQGKWGSQSIVLALPADMRPGTYEITAMPGDQLDAAEGRTVGNGFEPRDLNELFSALSRVRRADGLHLAVIRRDSGLRDASGVIRDAPASFLRIASAMDPSRYAVRQAAEILQERHILADRLFISGTTASLVVEE